MASHLPPTLLVDWPILLFNPTVVLALVALRAFSRDWARARFTLPPNQVQVRSILTCGVQLTRSKLPQPLWA